ncbi:hypothetical protein MRX96_001842 [Rhipicephalus microplus]
MASAGETDGDDKSSQFKFHKSEGKKLLKQGNVQGALQAFERAAEHQADDRLQAKIEKMREFLKSEQAQEASDSDMVEIGNGFYLCQAIERRLYTYQRTGLLWMWDLYLKKHFRRYYGEDHDPPYEDLLGTFMNMDKTRKDPPYNGMLVTLQQGMYMELRVKTSMVGSVDKDCMSEYLKTGWLGR